MIDIKEIRNNLELIKENLKKRNSQVNIDELILIDKNLRKLISDKERLESEKKLISKSKDEKNFLKSKRFSEEISNLDIKIEEQKKKVETSSRESRETTLKTSFVKKKIMKPTIK